jgi:hypothetical protein
MKTKDVEKRKRNEKDTNTKASALQSLLRATIRNTNVERMCAYVCVFALFFNNVVSLIV